MARRRVVIAELDAFIDRVLIQVALGVVDSLASAPSEGGTPVDTGWASANWIPYIGKPRRGTAGNRPDPKTGGGASRSVQLTQASKILLYRHSQGDIVVANNVPYIVELNDGSSTQAPRGFVQAGITKTVTKVAKGIRKL